MSKTTFKKIISYCCLLFFPMIALATNGPYITAEFGGISSTRSLIFDNQSGYGGRIAGGYLFGETHFNYGLESGVLYYPHLSGTDGLFFVTNDVVSGYNIDLLGVIKYTFDCHFLIFGKAGAAYVNQKITGKSNVGTITVTENDKYRSITPEVALGIGYQLTPKTEINLTTSTTFPNNSAAITTLMLGLSYSF